MTTPKCAVIIPTKNAMPGFASVLDKVRAQKAPWPFETIVIDSGSRDGTCAHVQQFDDVRLIQIDPKDFGHGRTRNQGVAETEAEFVAFLTHDAEPVDEDWLANMVAAAEQDPRIAGVFGRHVADQTASPFTRRDLDQHFQGFLAHPLIVHRDLDPEKYETDTGWQQFLHFYSDNNSL
ncbi:MAG: glycosyltransferase family A protein, partial [Pseudomonadota bacterium]